MIIIACNSGCQRRWHSTRGNEGLKYSLGVSPWGRHLKRALSNQGSKSDDSKQSPGSGKKSADSVPSTTTKTVNSAAGQIQATIKGEQNWLKCRRHCRQIPSLFKYFEQFNWAAAPLQREQSFVESHFYYCP